MKIQYEDRSVLVVEKPAGQLTQSGRTFSPDLVSEVMTARRRKGEPPYAAVINRLDRPVGGLVLLAKDQKTAARLTRQMQQHEIRKDYLALLCGKPAQASGHFVDYLYKDGRTNKTEVVPEGTPGSRLAELEYEVIGTQQEGKLTLVRIHLLTGRHHQIRAQWASRGLPVLGDSKYADEKLLERYRGMAEYPASGAIALWAYELQVDGRRLESLPQWLSEENIGKLKK